MRLHGRRRFGILLTLTLMLGLLSGLRATALANDDNPYASLKNTTTTVTFSGMQWYIIADDSTSATAGTVTLLSANGVGGGQNSMN